jgi:type IV pilus assembly protein PilC
LQFRYIAVDHKNKKSRGVLDAENKAAVIAKLQENGLSPIEVAATAEENAEPKSIWERDIGSSDIHKTKIPKKRLLAMMHQMGIMMKAGVSLSMAMGVLIDGERNKKLRSILNEMNSDLYTGIPISAAMTKFRAFPEILVNIIQSGEANGRLDTAFERCAVILEKEISLSAKLNGAMRYPIFLMILTIAMLIVMNVVVLPNFASVFKQFGAQLPMITVAVMGFSSFLAAYWYLIVLAIFLIIFTFIILKKKCDPFSTEVDRIMLRFPVVGKLLRQSYIARFCRIMSSLVESGVDIVSSLGISRNVIPNRYMKKQLAQVIADVKVGSSINASVAQFPIFDSLLVSMLKVGEESGMLYETLDKMATLYEEETDESTKRLTNMMEPAMTIIIALIVGTVVVAIVLPMFSMYGVVAGG